MINPKQSLSDRALSLHGSDLSYFLGALHPDDLAGLWQNLAPWQCETVWSRFRRARQSHDRGAA